MSEERFPYHYGGGWYRLSDGSTARGKEAALRAQAELNQARHGPNRAALEATIALLRDRKRLDPDQSESAVTGPHTQAYLQLVRSLADAVDLVIDNAALWRQYREALEGLTADEDDGGSIDDLIAELSTT